jgi:hypothetical protein
VQQTVDHYMDAAGITNYSHTTRISQDGGNTWTVASLSTANSYDSVGISVSVPYSDVTWGPLGLIDSSRTFSASVVMRKE